MSTNSGHHARSECTLNVSTILVPVVLLGLFLLMGVLTRPRKLRLRQGNVAEFLLALLMSIALVLISYLTLILAFFLYIFTAGLFADNLNLFLDGIIVVVGSGVILFIISRPILRRLRVTQRVLTITEYIIQWFLIYVTIYQVMVERLDALAPLIDSPGDDWSIRELFQDGVSPDMIILLLLPVLITVWITVAMLKIRMENEEESRA